MSKVHFPDAEAGIHSINHFGLAAPNLDEQRLERIHENLPLAQANGFKKAMWEDKR